MSALDQDRATERRAGVQVPYKVINADCIYGGSLVAVNAAGYALPGADTAGLIFVGVSDARADNTLGAAGAIEVPVTRRGLFRFASASALTIANVGDNVFLYDDQTVALVGDVTNAIFCGVIALVEGAADCWIDIEPAIKQADVATHIADTSAAHAASAIALTDAGAHFAASEGTAEAALQKLAKNVLLSFSVGTIATAASDAKIAENFKFPVPVRVKRAYATVGTAPGSGKTLTIEIKVGAGADATLCTVAGTATTGAAENLDIAIAADTAVDIQLTQDTGAAADLTLVLVAEVDDGE